MGASSVTGKGLGSSKKLTGKELSSLANGPKIYFSGIIAGESVPTSPPSSNMNTVVFPYALEGGAENYVVMLTSINGGYTYITDLDETDGNFTGFSFAVEEESDVMYMVVDCGIRPIVIV